MSRRLWVATLVACGAISACDRTSPQTPLPGSQTGEERISGNERLGWDQPANDRSEIASLRYSIYVDGIRSELTDVSCAATPSPAGFACSGRLPPMPPGSHTLELTAVATVGPVLESPRSSPFRVFVAPTAVTRPSALRPGGTVITTADRVRLRVDVVADGLDEPTDVAFTPDGRVFIAERRGRVRVVRDGVLQAKPALVLSDVATTGAGGLIGLALDPSFERTRFVYAIYTTPARSDTHAFTIARFREANDTLADRAILLDEVPTSPTHTAGSVRFGPDGKLYVAFDDGGDPRSGGDLTSFNGKVLRMNADATTPDDQAGATPVYSYEYRSPRGFDWNPDTGALWIADQAAQDSTRLSVVTSGPGRLKRGTVQAAYTLPAATGASSVAFYRGGALPAFRDNLLVAADEGRHILRIQFDPRNPTRILTTERLLEDRVEGVRVVSVAPGGAIYFCTASVLARLVPAAT